MCSNYRETFEQYDKDHALCPECGSDSFTTTLAGRAPHTVTGDVKDTNKVWCHGCKWSGIRHEMVPK